eukprot:176089-Pelagomonas_calceolata.AAC.2
MVPSHTVLASCLSPYNHSPPEGNELTLAHTYSRKEQFSGAIHHHRSFRAGMIEAEAALPVPQLPPAPAGAARPACAAPASPAAPPGGPGAAPLAFPCSCTPTGGSAETATAAVCAPDHTGAAKMGNAVCVCLARPQIGWAEEEGMGEGAELGVQPQDWG